MKKVNFFKVMSAAMAFAAVTFTACSEEEMKIDTPDVEIEAQPLPAALAQASVTVYDAVTMELLATDLIDVTAKMGATAPIACPDDFANAAKYLIPADVNIEVPSLVAGQVAILPVNFYVAGIGTAQAAVLANLVKENITETVVEEVEIDAAKSYLSAKNTSKFDKTYNFYFEGYDWVATPTILVDSRAATTANDVLLANKSFPTEFKTKKFEAEPYTLWAYHFININVKQEITTNTYEFEWNGAPQTVVLSSVTEFTSTSTNGIIPELEHEWYHGSHSHSHGHGHGHGADNAGGGIVWAE